MALDDINQFHEQVRADRLFLDVFDSMPERGLIGQHFLGMGIEF
jgi:hypothetical protein